MSHQIPFHQDTFRPKSLPGNDSASTPVEFDLSAVGGADKARIKALISATAAVAYLTEWTPEMTRNVTDAFRTGPGVFVAGVDAIRGLTVPAALALKAGVITKLERGQRPTSPVSISTGAQFAAIAGHALVLALEVAMAIGRLSEDAEIDPRFFASLSGSPEETPDGQSGPALAATKADAPSATVAAETPAAS